MNRKELIDAVSEQVGLTKLKTGETLNAILDAITTSLNNGQNVTFVGFGTFQTADRKARKGRNPKTGREILISAKKVAKFKAGSALSKSVNGAVSA